MRVAQIALIFILVALINNIHGQSFRVFPENSHFGELTAFNFPQVEIDDDEIMYLGVGAQVRGTDNLIILPSTLDQTGLIRYQLNTMGNVHRIWFLTPEEISQSENQADNTSD